MQEQLKDYIEKIPSGFAFNLRYRPENLRKFDVLKPVDRKEPNVKTSYYTSLYNLKTIFKLEDHFVFQPGFRTEETDIDVKKVLLVVLIFQNVIQLSKKLFTIIL